MRQSIVISLHVAFWVTIISNRVLSNFIVGHLLEASDIKHAYFYSTFLQPLFFYLFYSFTFNILKNKKILLYSALLLTCICLTVFFIKPQFMGYLVMVISNFVAWGITGGLFRFFVDWLNKDKIQLQLSRQNLQSELALLRTQINPHFLFNSLHNIDTLISVNPEKASDSLIKLSDLMRYNLHDADTDFIELSKEMDYVKKYLSLQELRLANKELIEFKIDGNTDNIKIAPMLFMPFVENAFKHITDKEVKAGISINFQISKHWIKLDVINVFDENKKTVKDETSGIGLSNVKRRLELIYPNSHKLEISKEKDRYKVELTIDMYAN